MIREIKIPVKQDPLKLYQSIKREFLSNGMKFDGNENCGKFSGSGVEGDYSIAGQLLTIRINKKPMLIPIGVIENKIKEYFKDL